MRIALSQTKITGGGVGVLQAVEMFFFIELDIQQQRKFYIKDAHFAVFIAAAFQRFFAGNNFNISNHIFVAATTRDDAVKWQFSFKIFQIAFIIFGGV